MKRDHYREAYGKWAGNPAGLPPDYSRCAAEVQDNITMLFHQCSRKSGHGPDNAYCRQHAKKTAWYKDGELRPIEETRDHTRPNKGRT